jgi:hypothetical protein
MCGQWSAVPDQMALRCHLGGGVVGNADRGRQLYIRRGGFGLHNPHATNGDEDIIPHRDFRPRGSARDHEPVATSDDRAPV